MVHDNFMQMIVHFAYQYLHYHVVRHTKIDKFKIVSFKKNIKGYADDEYCLRLHSTQ